MRVFPILLSLLFGAFAFAQDDEATPAAAETAAEPAEEAEEEKPEKKEDEKDPAVVALKKEVELLNLERDKLLAENSIAEAQLKKELAERKAQIERDKLELEETQAAERSDEFAKLKAQLEMMQLEAQIAKAESDETMSRLKKSEDELKAQVSRLNYEIQQKDKEKQRGDYADQKPVYLEEPLQGGTLIISDRRIELNGVISSRTSSHISERINYYNNSSVEYPIFIVIDDSPGGSVMAGYKILKSMESSEAPVYVVVKSYAASMAAVITALADDSFAYPNAILLQHQLSGFLAGNRTELQEEVAETEEWWVRLAKPVSDKMGITLDDFVKQMYEEQSTGDWDEFADDAIELKWVNNIVDEIRETGLVKNPDAAKSTVTITPKVGVAIAASGGEDFVDEAGLRYTADERGRPICILPRINPHDRWWLHNPDGYFRAP
ncbi:MAG: ATP-dependent Clp protease proteolytic subunit [Verrucomicrobiota bacterium]